MTERLRSSVIIILALALMWCLPSVAQVMKGAISGTISDGKGASIGETQVTATSVETGATFHAATDASGAFRLNLLPAGNYSVEIVLRGFVTEVREDIRVVAGRDTGLGNVRLSPGASSERSAVTVGELASSKPTGPQVTSTFSGAALDTFVGVQESEGLDRLALFIPGVINSRSNNFTNSKGVGFSTQGLRGRNNNQLIDGQDNNDNSIGGPAIFLSDPNFIQQYVVVTNNMGPENGRNSGSVVNLITKSGTNAWHGSIFGSENNSYFNSLTNQQKFDGLSKPPRSNTALSGVTLGGPGIKNRLFVFGGFEDLITSSNTNYTSNSLTPTPSGLTQLQACSGLDANALAALTQFGPYAFTAGNPTPVPDPTTGQFTTQTINGCTVQFGGVTRTLPTPAHVFNWMGRADLQLGNNTISSRYVFDRDNSFNNGDNGAGGWVDNATALSQAVLLSWTHNFSARMANEARVSFDRVNIQFGGNTIGNTAEPVARDLTTALTHVRFSFPDLLGFGPSTDFPQGRIANTWQAQDNWNYVLGKHQLKAGVNYSYQNSPQTFLPSINGDFQFTNWDTLLTSNTPNAITIANGDTVFTFHEHDTVLYAGDDWKLARNLVLNLGLTWTYYGSPSNLFNQITTQRESNSSTAFWDTSLPLSVRTVPAVPATHTNFGPGVGFAYSPQWGGFLTGHGRTVIRGGYRLLYDPPFYNMFLNHYNSAPTVFLQTLTGVQAASNPLPATPTGSAVRTELAPFVARGVSDPRLFDQTTLSPNFGPDKVQSWSFGVQREITKNSALEARYVGNHATNLYQAVDGNPFIADLTTDFPNLVPPGLTPCPVASAFNAVAVGRVDCNRGVVRTLTNGGFSDYNGLQLEFRANNLFKQLTIRTGYTYSKTLDNVSEVFSTNGAGNTLAYAQNPAQTGGAEKSLSGLNVPNVWTVIFLERAPFFKSQRGWKGHSLGGWTIAGNYILASGQGYTPMQSGEANFTASGNFYDSAFLSRFAGGDTARPFLGNWNAPADSVGVFATDICRAYFGVTPANNAAFPGVCNTSITPADSLISFSALNQGGFLQGAGTQAGQAPVTTTSSQVRYIVNGGFAQQTFGTPFGNVTRNSVRDGIQNSSNLSLYKEIRLTERNSLEVRATAVNAFNHPNYWNVDPFIEDAGMTGRFNTGFANPQATTAAGRKFYFGAKLTF